MTVNLPQYPDVANGQTYYQKQAHSLFKENRTCFLRVNLALYLYENCSECLVR